jgi:hypothetical protein
MFISLDLPKICRPYVGLISYWKKFKSCLSFNIFKIKMNILFFLKKEFFSDFKYSLREREKNEDKKC